MVFPRSINPEKVKEEILQFQEVKNVHHIHIWAMSTTENALTAHIIVADDFSLSSFEPLKTKIHQVLNNLNIQHSTLEIELESESCIEGKV